MAADDVAGMTVDDALSVLGGALTPDQDAVVQQNQELGWFFVGVDDQGQICFTDDPPIRPYAAESVPLPETSNNWTISFYMDNLNEKYQFESVNGTASMYIPAGETFSPSLYFVDSKISLPRGAVVNSMSDLRVAYRLGQQTREYSMTFSDFIGYLSTDVSVDRDYFYDGSTLYYPIDVACTRLRFESDEDVVVLDGPNTTLPDDGLVRLTSLSLTWGYDYDPAGMIVDAVDKGAADIIDNANKNHEENKGLLGKIISGITELPQKIWGLISDGLKALFIPSDDFLDKQLQAFGDSFDKMGFLGYPLSRSIDFLTGLADAGSSDFKFAGYTFLSAGKFVIPSYSISFNGKSYKLWDDIKWSYNDFFGYMPDAVNALLTMFIYLLGGLCVVSYAMHMARKYFGVILSDNVVLSVFGSLDNTVLDAMVDDLTEEEEYELDFYRERDRRIRRQLELSDYMVHGTRIHHKGG